jgi:DNA-directed RNA polymerase sigma subunit (sigma70/sigma32)
VKGLESSLDREPTDDEIVSYIEENVNEKMTSDEYHALMKDGGTDLISLNKKIGSSDSDGQELMYFIKDNVNLSSDIDTMINEVSKRSEIDQIINRSGINDRTKMIIGLYFGLNPETIGNITVETGDGTQITYEQAFLIMTTWKRSTLEGIGNILGITRERVRQIKLSGLIKIQNQALTQ